MTFQITNDTFQKHYNSYFKLAPNNLLKDNLYLCFTAFLNQRKKNEKQNISSDVLCKHFDVIYIYDHDENECWKKNIFNSFGAQRSQQKKKLLLMYSHICTSIKIYWYYSLFVISAQMNVFFYCELDFEMSNVNNLCLLWS